MKKLNKAFSNIFCLCLTLMAFMVGTGFTADGTTFSNTGLILNASADCDDGKGSEDNVGESSESNEPESTGEPEQPVAIKPLFIFGTRVG